MAAKNFTYHGNTDAARGMNFILSVEEMDTDDTVILTPDSDVCWALQNVFHDKKLKLSYYDAVNSTECVFHQDVDSEDFISLLHFPSFDGAKAYLKITALEDTTFVFVTGRVEA